MAETYVHEILDKLTIESKKEHRLLATRTSLAGKGHHSMQVLLSQLAVEAAEAIHVSTPDGKIADPTRVKILPQSGGSINDTQLVTGLVLAKNRIHEDMPRNVGAGKILLVDGGIERRSMNSDMNLKVTSPESWKVSVRRK